MNAQCFTTLCNRTFAAPFVQHAAHCKWADIGQRGKLFVCDVKINPSRVHIAFAFSQVEQCFRNAIVGCVSKDRCVPISEQREVLQNDSQGVTSNLGICQGESADDCVLP